MLDVFSRYGVGWMVAHGESATLAERFIHETCARQGIGRDHLTTHADPDRFGSLQDARVHGQSFFTWYSTAHHHSGLGLLNPPKPRALAEVALTKLDHRLSHSC